ncbi:MAG TPA: NfeD family protein [Kiritimatiellia bacterium]|nr:NfeD family protein [Kiritimatiellia bacterium]
MPNFIRKYFFLLLAALIGFPLTPAGYAEEAIEAEAPAPVTGNAPLVYVIPIKDMIEPSLVYIIRRGLREAQSVKASAIVFVMDTPGGRVDTTEEITRLIEAVKVPTYTFVEHNAISAGAIIALSTDYIYMAPGSKIGDAMPVIASPQGGMQSLGDAEREKVESYVDSLIRGIAQRKGRSEEMASAMVRRTVEYKIGDTIISKEGEILTLTHLEAERRFVIDGVERALLSEATVDDVEAMLAKIGLANAEIKKLEVTDLEKIARFISMIAPVLLTIGMLALWVEFQTPGIGWGAVVGIVCLTLFFFGHHIAGLAGKEEILLFVLGLILLLIEIFALPGFGLIGLTGIFLMMWSLLTAMAPTLPGGPMIPSLPDLKIPIRNMVISLIMSGIGMLLLSRYLPKSRATSWLVLKESTSAKEGYRSSDENASLMGQIGRTITPLRPSGAAMFGDLRQDVVARGEFIAEKTPIKVVEVHGNRVVVDSANDEVIQ